MRIFSGGTTWGSKVNFVDDNNVFVGFDDSQSCCEDAGYFFSEDITDYSYESTNLGIEMDNEALKNYSFDKSFHEFGDGDLDAGGMIIFLLNSSIESEEDIYLHLYNSHNGYYSHGFEFKDGDKLILDDSL